MIPKISNHEILLYHLVGILSIINPPINDTIKNINCFIKKYVDVLLYLSPAAAKDEEKTIKRPILHKNSIIKNNGLSIFENVFFI